MMFNKFKRKSKMSEKDKNLKEDIELNQEETPVEEVNTNNQENSETQTLSEVDALKVQLKEQEDKYLRLYAEFDNFRRRNAKERLDLIQNASQETLNALLPVLDDFERSLKASEQNIDGLKEGVDLVYRKFNGILEAKGLKKMEALGKEFDADLHEAITQIPVEDEKQKGLIVDVVEDGYVLNDKVIRFAKVIIGA